MSHKDGRVVLSAWVEPVVRDYAREAARVSGLEFSRWIERAVRIAAGLGVPLSEFLDAAKAEWKFAQKAKPAVETCK